MNVASFGFEADQMNRSTVTVLVPLLKPIILRGYQIDLGLMAWNSPGMFGGGWTEVLFSAELGGMPALPGYFGPVTYSDATGSRQNLHGNQMASGIFCRAVVKGFIGIQSAVNKALVMDGLNIPVAPGNLVFSAGHAGAGPIDFEVQGCLYFDEAN